MRMQTVMFEGRCFFMLKIALKSSVWLALEVWDPSCDPCCLQSGITCSRHQLALSQGPNTCSVMLVGVLHKPSSDNSVMCLYFRGPLEFFIHFTWAKNLWKGGFAIQCLSLSLLSQMQEACICWFASDIGEERLICLSHFHLVILICPWVVPLTPSAPFPANW